MQTFTKIDDSLFGILTLEEAVVYTKIKDLCKKQGTCSYSDQELCDLFFKTCNRRKIMRIKQNLINKGFLTKIKQGIKGGGSRSLITVVSEFDESQNIDNTKVNILTTKVKILTNESQNIDFPILYKNKNKNKNKTKKRKTNKKFDKKSINFLEDKKCIEESEASQGSKLQKLEKLEVQMDKINKEISRKWKNLSETATQALYETCIVLEEKGTALRPQLEKIHKQCGNDETLIQLVCNKFLENCDSYNGIFSCEKEISQIRKTKLLFTKPKASCTIVENWEGGSI